MTLDYSSKCASFQCYMARDKSIFDDSNISKNHDICENKLSQVELKLDTLNFFDSYPGVANSYGGSLPLSRLSNTDTVNVYSSIRWRNKNFAIPKANPSFNKLWNDYPEIFH